MMIQTIRSILMCIGIPLYIQRWLFMYLCYLIHVMKIVSFYFKIKIVNIITNLKNYFNELKYLILQHFITHNHSISTTSITSMGD